MIGFDPALDDGLPVGCDLNRIPCSGHMTGQVERFKLISYGGKELLEIEGAIGRRHKPYKAQALACRERCQANVAFLKVSKAFS